VSDWYKVAPFLCMIWSCNPRPSPTPTPSPTVAPTPTHSPTPTVEPTPIACEIPDESQTWSPAGAATGVRKPEVRAAQAAMGDVCGEPFIATLDRIAEQLRLGTVTTAPVCAGRMTDAVYVEAQPGLFEEWHPVFSGNGCWTTNTPKYLWVREEGAQ